MCTDRSERANERCYVTAATMTRIAGRLEKLLNPDDELQGWTITRRTGQVLVVLTYRSGITHSIDISTADPEFINASL